MSLPTDEPGGELEILGGAVRIPARALGERFSRSGGPGGQNVNKVASRAEVRLDLAAAAEALGPERLARIRERLAHRITREGEILIVSDRFRDQPRNRADCRSRLRELLEMALRRPKKRVRTRPTRSARE